VVTDAAAVKIRAEDGRSVVRVDVSPFIGELPGGKGTVAFSTPEASGSTSQAAAIVEALEAGARVLLVDEDTAATNLMVRDRRMQALIPREREPIIPFVDRVRDLHAGEGVSSILVLGGSGDYLDVADTVIGMVEFRAEDLTARAREVAAALPTGRASEGAGALAPRPRRVPLPGSIDPSSGRRATRVAVRGAQSILFGENDIDLAAVEQLVSRAQVRGVAEALLLARQRFMDGTASIPELLDRVMELVEGEGLDALAGGRAGDLAGFRRFELAAALNRVRGLEVAG
jgi:predicted ABC-class ATPase